MLNLKKLLNKITSAIVELTDWKDDTTTLLAQAADYGTVYYQSHSSSDPVSLKTGTYTNVCSVTLPPGRYIVYSRIMFPSNTTGARFLSIGSNSAQLNTYGASSVPPSGAIRLMCWHTFAISEQQKIYAVAYQSSGSTMSITSVGIYAYKIGNVS